VCINCPLCCKHELRSFNELKEHLSHYAAGSLQCPLCSHSSSGLEKLILHLNAHDVQCEEDEEKKKVNDSEGNSESYIMNADTQMEIASGAINSCSASKCEMGIVAECEVASVIECERKDVEHCNQQFPNDIEEHIQECVEQVQEYMNNANNLNSVCLVETDYSQTFEVVNDLVTQCNGPEAKEDNTEVSSSDIDAAHNEPQYTCGMCGISFKSMDVLKEHALDIHGIKYIVIEGSTEGNSLRKHPDNDVLDSVDNEHTEPRRGKHKKVPVHQVCPKTRLHWILPKPLTTEVRGVDFSIYDKGSEMHRIDCSLCGKQFEQQSKYEIHKYVHLDRKHWPLECPLCQKHFITKGAYNRHLLSVHKVDKAPSILEICAKSVPCGVCGKYYQNTGHLKRHILTHCKTLGKASTKTIKCEQCDKLCLSEGELQRHIDRIHLKVRRCLCTVCGKKFFDGSALKAHSKTHWEVKPYPCGYCDKRFADAFEVKRHERGHTGEKPHVCEICGKTFRQGYFLNVHLRSHTGEKPYSCSICGAAFTCKSTLRNHKLIHVDVKAFNCTHCDKSFRTSIQLYNHVRLHTRPFKCEVCSKGFSSRVILSKHIRTHEKNYSCKKCGTQFTALHKLNKHEKECCVFENNIVYDLHSSGQ